MKKVKYINTKRQQRLLHIFFPYYKSFIFKNTEFKTNNKEINKDKIIDVLNIKNRRNRLEYIYDSICDELDNFYKDKNICGFKNSKCYTQQKPNCKYINGCCRKCIYQSENGCKTRNVSCKLFMCNEVKKRFEILEFKDIEIRKLLTIRQRVMLKHSHFSSREEVIRDLEIGLISVFTIRVLFRYLTKNII